MKRIIAFVLVALMMTTVIGCTKNEEGDKEQNKTVGQILLADFKANVDGSAQEIADNLLKNAIIEFAGTSSPVEPGLLVGFGNTEIKGFKEGVMFAPMIGTIPFLGYVFVLEDNTDVDAFQKRLEDSANLRWNICTEAEELTVENKGNKVFFLMSPKSFE